MSKSKRSKAADAESMDDIKLGRDERALYSQLQSRNYMAKSQDEVYGYVPDGRDRAWLMGALNKLMGCGLVILKQDSSEQLSYQPVAPADARKLRQIESDDDRMVYTQVRDAGTSGVWTRTLKQKTMLHTTVINRAVKNLENMSMIKIFRHVQYPTRKYYILYDLQPSTEVSGGTFFTDSELDVGFVNAVRQVLLHSIEKATYPDMDDRQVIAAPAGRWRDKAATDLSKLTRILNSGAFEVKLEEADAKALLDTLVYDGKVQLLGDGTYRAVSAVPECRPLPAHGGDDDGEDDAGDGEAGSAEPFDQLPALMQIPCGECPVFHLCEPGGVVSPEGCTYWSAWLERNM